MKQFRPIKSLRGERAPISRQALRVREDKRRRRKKKRKTYARLRPCTCTPARGCRCVIQGSRRLAKGALEEKRVRSRRTQFSADGKRSSRATPGWLARFFSPPLPSLSLLSLATTASARPPLSPWQMPGGQGEPPLKRRIILFLIRIARIPRAPAIHPD